MSYWWVCWTNSRILQRSYGVYQQQLKIILHQHFVFYLHFKQITDKKHEKTIINKTDFIPAEVSESLKLKSIFFNLYILWLVYYIAFYICGISDSSTYIVSLYEYVMYLTICLPRQSISNLHFSTRALKFFTVFTKKKYNFKYLELNFC